MSSTYNSDGVSFDTLVDAFYVSVTFQARRLIEQMTNEIKREGTEKKRAHLGYLIASIRHDVAGLFSDDE